MFQLSDVIIINGKRHLLIAQTVPFNFNPELYGVIPDPFHINCLNGYWTEYEVIEERLNVKRLYINSTRYKLINGVKAKKTKGNDMISLGHHLYKNLNILENYTGSLMLGSGTLLKYISNLGYADAYAYKEVIEVDFIDGKIVNITDYSKEVEEVRKTIVERKNEFTPLSFTKDKLDPEAEKILEQTFSLRYEEKCWWLEKDKEKVC
ncbi:hypothetical protein [Fusobacterium ulcerans]|uniref:hypothetical protein n=1 Tax=Fusobacterium ulcerans TaxID=861 RepID=UPI0030B17DE7